MFAIEIIIKNSLYAIKYENSDDKFENTEFVENKQSNEFCRLFNNWQDPEYLYNFFNEHKQDLQKKFFNYISIEKAILKTIDTAYKFQQKILSTAEKEKNDDYQNLQTLFVPLNNYEKVIFPIPEHQKSKAYGSKKSWLRMYAIRIEKNVFIITGGAIKLTRTMNERKHLRKELKKLENVKQFLISEGIIDDDSIIEFLELKF